ncbi:MAG: radical SAM protein [Candidatus Omnitrophica bacterium]|nr:radical SAM protein [Candidatus Omnitrophota bacterium]
MSSRRFKFLKIENYIIYHFPYLRHFKYMMINKKIKHNGKLYYQQRLQQSLNSCLRPLQLTKLREKPGGHLIELSNICNLKCPMCGTHLAKRKKAHMDLKIYKRLLERIKDEGVNAVSLHTVGEPLVYPWLKEAISIAKKMGIEVLISTNANLHQRLKSVYEANPDWVKGFRFSVDAATPETYEKIRVDGKLAKVIESCEWVVKTNKRRHMSNISLFINCVISKENIKEMATFFRVFSKYTFPENIHFALINSLTPDTNYFDEKKLPFPNLYQRKIPCSTVFNSIFFNNKGKATLCCRDYDDQLIIGDAVEQPISKIWRSEIAQKIRRQHLQEEEMVIPQCKQCCVSKPGVGRALDDFIHLLQFTSPNFNNQEWSEKILSFLENLNSLLDKSETGQQKEVLTMIESFVSKGS